MRNCGPGWSIEPEVQRAADARREGERMSERELRELLNRNSEENESNTPDSILASYLVRCLDAYNVATRAREEWYGVELVPGKATAPVPASALAELREALVLWDKHHSDTAPGEFEDCRCGACKSLRHLVAKARAVVGERKEGG